jgi:hypothetical protein
MRKRVDPTTPTLAIRLALLASIAEGNQSDRVADAEPMMQRALASLRSRFRSPIIPAVPMHSIFTPRCSVPPTDARRLKLTFD